MLRTLSRVIMTAAAASVAILPIAAQAETRAGDSGAVYSVSSSQPGLGRSSEGESAIGGFGILLALLAAGLIATGIFFAADDGDDDDQSPGT